jgi:hypothetical protein
MANWPRWLLASASMPDSGNYVARSAALRDTAKWIAAVFAGTGAVLFSGLSFTNIEQLASSARWILPVLLAAVPVLAAAWAVRSAASVIGQDPPDPGQLLPKLEGKSDLTAAGSQLRARIAELLPATVAIFGSIEKFEDRLVQVRDRAAQAQKVFADQPTTENREAVQTETEELALLQEGVLDLVLCADFILVKDRYNRARWSFLGAALVGVVAAVASGVLAAQDARTPAGHATAAIVSALPIDNPMAVQVYIRANTPKIPCPLSDGQSAIAIGGTLTRPLLLFTAAPKPRATSTTPERCLVPWTWAPAANQVVVVPQVRSNG